MVSQQDEEPPLLEEENKYNDNKCAKDLVDNTERFDLKVLHAGFHRSGTDSTALALDIIGFGPVWHMNQIAF